MSRESLVDSLKALGFTLGRYAHPFGEVDPTEAATYTVFVEATAVEAEAALGSLVGDAAELRAQVSRLQEALAFAQSVIKSGEEWSPTCDEVIGGALAATEGSES